MNTIIIEEFGLFGGAATLSFYLLLFFRFLLVAQKTTNLFGKFLIVGLGFPLIFQALINMGVAVSLLPVTGQTLPLISSGGSSIWMTCAALGIILNVTKKEEEIKAEQTEKERREAALQKLIDQQLAQDELETQEAEALSNIEQLEDEEAFSIEDQSKGNPMDAVKNKI